MKKLLLSSSLWWPLICLGLLVAAPAARAGIAVPWNSFVPRRVFLCPAGDSAFVVIPRHMDMTPWGEDNVWADLCACPTVHLSRASARGYTLDAAGCVATETTVQMVQYGVYSFHLAGGGLCPGGTFRVYAGGVLLRTDSLVVSPDQDGNLIVDDNDVAMVEAKLGTSDPGADLDGDGVVTQADVALVRAHLGHASLDRPVPVQAATWGRIKLLYR